MRPGSRRRKPKENPSAAFESEIADVAVEALEVHAEARRCRAEFVRQRCAYTGAPEVTPGQKSWDVFVSAAHLARRYDVTPELFVAVVMERAAVDGFFWPNALGADRYVLPGIAGLRTRAHHRLGLYRAQLDRFTALLRFGPAASVLRAFGFEFVPLLRFIMARKYNEPAIAGSSRDAARHELLIHPEAHEAFGPLVKDLQ